MTDILILSALPDEQKFYFDNLHIKEKKSVSFVEMSICEYNGALIYLATTGMGTVNASLVLATLAAQIKFDAIFFSGTSGGVDSRMKIGDVVIAEDAFDADLFSVHDAVIGTPFESALINPHGNEMTPRFFNANPKLLSHINTDNWDFAVYKGRVATSNHFPSPAELYADIKTKNTLVIDMESVVVYQFAWLSKIPCLVIRGVSNTLDSKGGDDDVAQSDVSSSDHAAMLVLDCINSKYFSS